MVVVPCRLRRTPRLVRALVLIHAAFVSLAGAQSLDPAFRPDCNAEIFGLSAQPDGKFLVAGNFTQIGGVARNRLARLNADGSVDPGFNPNANTTTRIMRALPDGKIIVGGSFSSLDGAPRLRLTRLNSDGSVDPTFTTGTDGTVFEIALQPDGKILIGGNFTEVAGVSRSMLARLNADGSLDLGFNPNVSGANTTADGYVETIVLQPDGKILVGGNFARVGGQTRNGAVRLNPNGSVDPAFDPNASSDVQDFAVQPDGKILMVGSFIRVGAQTRNHIARFNADGSLDPVFTPSIGSTIQHVALQSDGKIVIAGTFLSVGSAVRSRLARLNVDGTTDSTFVHDVTGAVGGSTPAIYALLVPSPSQIVIGGAFSVVEDSSHIGLARFGTPPPIITAQPGNVLAAAGSTVSLTVATATAGVSYQWQRNGVNLPGVTTPTLSLPNLQAANTGAYTVAVTNSFGTSTTLPATVAIGSAQPSGYTFSTFAGLPGIAGNADGAASVARFRSPRSLSFDPSGNLYVVDSNGLRRITPGGAVSTVTTTAAQAVVVDPAGNIYTTAPPLIRQVTAAGSSTTFAGSSSAGYRDGPPGTAQLGQNLTGIAVDRSGNLYVADELNYAIRKINPAGSVTTLSEFDLYTDVDSPSALAVDAAGTVYFTYSRISGIGRVMPNGFTTKVVVNLTALAEQRPPTSVSERLAGLAIDGGGNIFVADAGNHLIRRLDAAGNLSLVGGFRGVTGSTDGDGSVARFSIPMAVAIDASGNLFVADFGNHTIRKGVPSVGPLNLVTAPGSTQVAAGAATTLSVAASGPNLRFQWKKDGVAIAGATNALYTLASASPGDFGSYTVVVTSGGTSIESPNAVLTVTDPVSPGRLINVATRGLVQPGGALTPGFVLRGTGSKQLLVRGVGPTLARFNVTGSLADPRIELATIAGAIAFANDDWATGGSAISSTAAAVGAFPLDAGSKDAATLATLNATGFNGFTVRVTGPDATASGLSLAEVYDADPANSPVRLINVSTRGFVGTGANALVPGFVIGGNTPMKVLIRAVGPGLTQFGVTGVLADPQLSVVPLGSSSNVALNDNWAGSPVLAAAFAAAGAFSLAPDSKDAAVLSLLPPGPYTVIVSGVGGTTGTALVEIYEVP